MTAAYRLTEKGYAATDSGSLPTPATHPTVYLAGPMSNIADANYPAFFAAARQLRAAGFTVLNPAEIDTGGIERAWEWYLRRSIALLVTAEAVVVLRGWLESRGANLEVNLAYQLGMRVVDAEELIGAGVGEEARP